MARRWLLKTEPSSYSFAQLCREKRTIWDGVRNPSALRNLKLMQKGDLCFVYHTGDEKAVVGVARALTSAYPDPTEGNPALVVIDVEAVEPLARPVTLKEIKANDKLAGWDLVRLPRLSVMPVTAEQWAEVEKMALRR